MDWTMDYRGELRLKGCAEDERVRAEAAVLRLEGAKHPSAGTTAERLRLGLSAGWIPWGVVVSLSRWCYTDTEGTYQSGLDAAKDVSRALFGGRILPRLGTDEARRLIDTSTARRAMDAFLTDRGPVAPSGSDAERGEAQSEDEECPDESGELTRGSRPARASRTGRGTRGRATHGSRYCLQRWVEEAPQELADRILLSSLSLSLVGVSDVIWKSPLAAEDFYEYRDDFLIPLRLAEHGGALRRFWPANGPQWDGLALLGLGERQGVLLVEAKAHPAECYSRCAAADPTSVEMIESAFRRVRLASNVDEADWKEGAYQLANRLAFLYFLNAELGVPAWLALVYFVNDTSHRPTTFAQWRAAVREPFRLLGLAADCRLLERICPVFVEARASRSEVVRDPLQPHPELSKIVIHEDPTAPLDESEWPEECRG